MDKENKKIVILGGGGSLEQFIQLQLLPKGQSPIHDAEVWAINFVGLTIRCDKIIAMDYITKDCWSEDKLKFLQDTQLPVISCHVSEGINVIEYPIKEVTSYFNGLSYFNTTVAYAIALAIYQGATVIGLYGIDFTWPGEKNLSEAGRGCAEFWLGIAMERGISIQLPGNTTLLDTYNGRRPYGYADYEEMKLHESNH